ncbi:hypothetical protein CMI37_23565 [Candidatus Pacearchaeota archaeon]|nr:hypothetical protein [Candidatus Pacearchaeota archaeon]
MILQYHMLRGNDYPPVRANPSDAGLDLRWCPEDAATRGLIIKPGESKILGTGCKFAIPHSYMMEIKNRSSMAAKKHLIVGACVVDSGYDSEVFVNLHNIGTINQAIKPGDKIAQAVIVPVVHARFIASATPDIYDWYPITISNRGDGALGSTGE